MVIMDKKKNSDSNNVNDIMEAKRTGKGSCSMSGERLSHNYREWLKSNPGKSFSDFKGDVSPRDGENPKKKDWKNTVIAVLSSIIFIFIGHHIYKYFEDEFIIFSKFETKEYDKTGIEIESPFILVKEKIEVPEQVRNLIKIFENYTYKNANDFVIHLSYAEYKPKVGSADLEGAVAGMINTMKMNPKIRDFAYRKREGSLKYIPGVIITSQFILDNNKSRAISAIYALKLKLWQVTVTYRENDKKSKRAAKRIIDSIKIKNAGGVFSNDFKEFRRKNLDGLD